MSSYDRLISTMGFLILVRWYLYIESGPWLLWLYWWMVCNHGRVPTLYKRLIYFNYFNINTAHIIAGPWSTIKEWSVLCCNIMAWQHFQKLCRHYLSKAFYATKRLIIRFKSQQSLFLRVQLTVIPPFVQVITWNNDDKNSLSHNVQLHTISCYN